MFTSGCRPWLKNVSCLMRPLELIQPMCMIIARPSQCIAEVRVRMKFPGVCFSKVPKSFGRISGDIIPFVSSKRWRLGHETLQLFLFLFPLQHIKRPALQNKQVVVLRMAFRARKVLGTFEKRPPGLSCCL